MSANHLLDIEHALNYAHMFALAGFFVMIDLIYILQGQFTNTESNIEVATVWVTQTFWIWVNREL